MLLHFSFLCSHLKPAICAQETEEGDPTKPWWLKSLCVGRDSLPPASNTGSCMAPHCGPVGYEQGSQKPGAEGLLWSLGSFHAWVTGQRQLEKWLVQARETQGKQALSVGNRKHWIRMGTSAKATVWLHLLAGIGLRDGQGVQVCCIFICFLPLSLEPYERRKYQQG